MTKKEILQQICYTQLVYERVNKKLNSSLSSEEIEKKIYHLIHETDESFFYLKGKNIYVNNEEAAVRMTINKNTCRLITVDKIKK